jgi:hypothetical protein
MGPAPVRDVARANAYDRRYLCKPAAPPLQDFAAH